MKRYHREIEYFGYELSDEEKQWLAKLARDVDLTIMEREHASDESLKKIIYLAVELSYKKGKFEQWRRH